MERPLCPICETKHFAREPHVFKSEVNPLDEILRVEPKANGETDQPVIPMAGKPAGVSERRPSKSKFDRTAYQREYMREYMRKRRTRS